MAINHVTLVGRVRHDPVWTKTPGGKDVINLTLVTDGYEDPLGKFHDKVEYHRLVFWGANAGRIEGKVRQGSEILIEGYLQTRGWINKAKQQRTTTEVVVTKIHLSGSSKLLPHQPKEDENED